MGRMTAEERFANAERTLKNKETKCDAKFEDDKNTKIELINRI